MWNDEIEKRFSWAPQKEELQQILLELIKAEEEEDAAIYLLMMHYDHAREVSPDTLQDQEKVLHHLSLLIGDSRKHQKLLQGMIEKLEERVEL